MGKRQNINRFAEDGRNPRSVGQTRIHAVIHWFTLMFILVFALWLRTDDLLSWRRQPHQAFYQNQPILTNFDGYFYLSLARDLINRTYAPDDPLRGAPEPQPRPWPPPMLSVLAAEIAAVSSWSLDWIAVLLPPLLGLTLALPLYWMGRLFGGRAMALVATCVGLCARYYIYRSNLGWFDTDCLNVTFAFLVTYLFMRFGLEPGRRRFLFLIVGLMFYGLFLLWWDQTRSSVTLICLAPLAVVLILFYRPKGRERWIALAAGMCVIGAVLIWQGPQGLTAPFKKAGGMLDYISKAQTDIFPNTGLSIFEQKPLSFEALVEKTTGNVIPFIIGMAGLGWLFYRQRGKAAALIPLFVLGSLSFFFARRFLIFLNPLIALGLGFAVQQLWNLRNRLPGLSLGTPVVAALLCYLPAHNSLGIVYWPKEIPPIVEGMHRLSQKTVEDALIWAWWDHGYPIRYWSERATINDGSLHSGRRTVCNALPLAVQNQQLAANFMNFYSQHGIQGLEKVFDAFGGPAAGMQMLEKILQAGPVKADPLLTQAGLPPDAQWHRFFFPPQQREIYLFLDLRLARTTYWWYWFGTWDIGLQDGRHAQFKFMRDSREADGLVKGPGLRADVNQGMLTYEQKTVQLSRSYILDEAGRTLTTYATDDGLVFVFKKQAHIAVLMDQPIARSVFSQLFVLADPDPAYFSLIAQNYPYYQIWKVTADRE